MSDVTDAPAFDPSKTWKTVTDDAPAFDPDKSWEPVKAAPGSAAAKLAAPETNTVTRDEQGRPRPITGLAADVGTAEKTRWQQFKDAFSDSTVDANRQSPMGNITNLANQAGSTIALATSPIEGVVTNLSRSITNPLNALAGKDTFSPEKLGGDLTSAGTMALTGPEGEAAKVMGNSLREAATPAVRGAISPERAALAKEAIDKYGIPITGVQVGVNPTTKAVASAVERLPLSGAGAHIAEQHDQWTRAVARTFGEDTPAITADVMDAAKTRIGNEMNRIERNAEVQIGPEATARLDDIKNVSETALTDEESKVINRLVDGATKNAKDGGIPGTVYGNLMRRGGPLDTAAGSQNRNIARVAGQIQDTLRDALQGSLSGDDLKAYRDARLQYKNMKTVEPLVNKTPDGRISPALLNNRVSVQFPNRAYDKGGNDLDKLAKIGQAFLKEAGSSNTAEREAGMNGLHRAGQLIAATAAGNFAGIPATIGATAATLGTGRLVTNYLRSPAFAAKVIDKALSPEPAINTIARFPGPETQKLLSQGNALRSLAAARQVPQLLQPNAPMAVPPQQTP